jgi:hypothetical protein
VSPGIRRFNLETVILLALIVIVVGGLLAFIMPFKMMSDIRRSGAGECYENCMRAFHWNYEEAPACIRDCRLQEA